MRNLNKRHCNVCTTEYLPTGSCSKYCSTCRPILTKQIKDAAIKSWQYHKGYLNGSGSGSKTGVGAENHRYTNGRCVFRKWAKELKASVGLCESCGKDIKEATHYQWVGHHKDHDPTNNVIENLMLLCKQCHQIEHKCWKAFEGVTTISKDSRIDNNPKRLAPKG